MEVRERLLLIGPNRRCEKTIVEQQLLLTADEKQALLLAETVEPITGDPFHSAGHPSLLKAMRERLCELGLTSEGPDKSPAASEQRDDSGESEGERVQDTALESLALSFNLAALGLQQLAGHRVSESGYTLDSAGQGVWAWFEYEHDEVGEDAAELALQLLAEIEPRLRWPTEPGENQDDLLAQLAVFLATAKKTVFPIDSEAIMQAALRHDIPCVKLERDPYKGLEGAFRVRRNSLLKLGHCGRKQVIDGTFCITRNAALMPLLHEPEALRRQLISLGVPLPRRDEAAGNCVMTKKAVRAAEKVGYPVVVRPVDRVFGEGVQSALNSADAVRTAIDAARRVSGALVVESHHDGKHYQVLLANQQLLAIFDSQQPLRLDPVHPSIVELVRRVANQLKCALLLLTIVSPDISRPLEETDGVVIGCDLAPRLDELLPADSPLLQSAADGLVEFLFPSGETGRIPIVAITGTNGKTTTTRMMTRILQTAGLYTGMACTEGVYLNDTIHQRVKDAGHGSHHHVLDNAEVQAAVLETYFGRILRLGFPFSWCDVAVCTNVSADHLGRIGTHTLEEMAEVKAAVIRRARHGAVLNADNAYCLGMRKNLSATTICLFSTEQGLNQLQLLAPDVTCFGYLEEQSGSEWLVFSQGSDSTPLIAVSDIPASLAGAARHNVSNALAAACAALLAGCPPETVCAGLQSFQPNFENTPGRLNVFEHLPFRVIMDYAHNADGFQALGAVADRQKITGQKIVVFAIPGDRRDEEIRHAATMLAGHFDLFVCRNYSGTRGRPAEEIPGLLKQGLLAAGVQEQAVFTIPDATRAMQFGLELAQEGDLLVLLPGEDEFDSTWDMINSFQPETGPAQIPPSENPQ